MLHVNEAEAAVNWIHPSVRIQLHDTTSAREISIAFPCNHIRVWPATRWRSGRIGTATDTFVRKCIVSDVTLAFPLATRRRGRSGCRLKIHLIQSNDSIDDSISATRRSTELSLSRHVNEVKGNCNTRQLARGGRVLTSIHCNELKRRDKSLLTQPVAIRRMALHSVWTGHHLYIVELRIKFYLQFRQ